MDVQWPLLIFGLLAGLGMGCLGFVSVSILLGKFKSLWKPGLVIALVAMVAGGLASALHMGNPGRVFYVLANLGSGISQELLATAAAGLILLALFIAVWRGASDGLVKVLAVLGLVAAVALAFITGHAYMQPSRPAWDTIFLPIMYVGAATAMGCFAMYLLGSVQKKSQDELRALGKVSFITVAVFAVTVALYLVGVATAPFGDASRSLSRVVFGDLAPLFWGLVVVLGLVIPLALSAGSLARPKVDAAGGVAAVSKPAAVAIGFVCLIAGSVAIRMIMYLLGSSVHAFLY